ncbi:hypothetical protein [Micromonospora endolithica]|uniref:Circularly permuted type 2 ATP-grasp protein n=1 Tax=Micromonospora endolithica TaxID=230091 RepID=A0A3A9YXR8_9ACTN|nr:hypothetical protein [Micromonospora endolithica]RKN40609.1 hypothetical protein D7223_26075 [Micromonospora endolithica]TWJ21691.1 hypothetical protein JD76_01801 [Micromonospora endolithica]
MLDVDYRWPSAAQPWLDLPADVRADMVAAGARSWREVFDGRATYNKQWRLARPPVMDETTLGVLNAVCDRLAQLIFEACRRRAGTAGELRRLLRVPDGETRLLDDDEPLTEALLDAFRPDVLLSDGVPKVVEYNIDSSLGGAFDADTTVRRFVDVYRRHGLTERIRLAAAPSAVDRRFAAIRAGLGLPDGARVAMLIDFDAEYPGLDDPERFFRLLTPVVDRAAVFGLDLVIAPVSQVTLDDQSRLVVRGGPVDGVFRLFVPNRVTPSAGVDALEAALAAGTVPMWVSAAAWLIANKAAFAWLWDDAGDLPAADRDLVHRYVPQTWMLTPDLVDRAIVEQRDLVAKPSDGSAGVDVLVGRACDADTWAGGVRRAADRGGFILQRYVKADDVPLDFVHIETGDTVSADVPYSIAPYLFGREPAGACIRTGFPGCDAVLNLARGVLLSGLLVVD